MCLNLKGSKVIWWHERIGVVVNNEISMYRFGGVGVNFIRWRHRTEDVWIRGLLRLVLCTKGFVTKNDMHSYTILSWSNIFLCSIIQEYDVSRDIILYILFGKHQEKLRNKRFEWLRVVLIPIYYSVVCPQGMPINISTTILWCNRFDHQVNRICNYSWIHSITAIC